ncbi:uncharacterized protein LOC111283988 [Durio zibethinus]|uniref:Uncharacterized protein LOC111283988 n=1 Tax=Durio zibethinus TaxID=66656 RepID=A0A6P5XKM4_DURZI|nr:uncharacterized protein LOC111283988 [Durio zibethinus]XP_022728432.1 uncharacterized protein LOC111283988 [Durio zibethinus]
MDHLFARQRDIEVDLESGGTTSEDERTKDDVSSNIQTKRTLSTFWSDLLTFDRIGKGECGINSCGSSSSFGAVEGENMEFLADKNSEQENHELMALVNKNSPEDKYKKTSPRKPPKPPRPPKGPLLDAVDQKLVREITELAMRKRARMKQIKAKKKMKAARASSTSSSLSAMVITVLFCLVIFFHGICSRRSGSVMLERSPAAAVGSSEGLIAVQFYKKFPTTEKHDHDPPSLVEQQVSGSVGEETRKVAR